RSFSGCRVDPFAHAGDDAAMTALPALDVLIAFTAASFVLIITPGPDMTLFIGQTLTAGRARGFAALMGASTGLLVHSMLAAFGPECRPARYWSCPPTGLRRRSAAPGG